MVRQRHYVAVDFNSTTTARRILQLRVHAPAFLRFAMQTRRLLGFRISLQEFGDSGIIILQKWCFLSIQKLVRSDMLDDYNNNNVQRKKSQFNQLVNCALDFQNDQDYASNSIVIIYSESLSN
jgi:hypothetical protein